MCLMPTEFIIFLYKYVFSVGIVKGDSKKDDSHSPSRIFMPTEIMITLYKYVFSVGIVERNSKHGGGAAAACM